MARFLSCLLIIIILGISMVIANDLALAFSDRLCAGLIIADIPVGGLSVSEAEEKVSVALRQRKSEPLLVLMYGNKKWDIAWEAIREKPEPAKLIRRAYAIGRTGNLPERLYSQYSTRNGGKTISLGLNPDSVVLREQLERIASSLDRDAINASVKESSAGIQIQQDVQGIRVDVSATLLKIAQALTVGSPKSLPLVVEEVAAGIRANDLQGINSLLAMYATTVDREESDRTHNIRLAAEKLNGLLVKNNEVFSFNQKVGPRSVENGFRKALTLTSTGTVMDWGGGICQVASTLYNAALLSGMGVLERSPHFQPPTYVPVGLDATVAEGQIDLKLINTSSHALYIHSRLMDEMLEIRIYGHKSDPGSAIRVEASEKQVQTQKTVVRQDPLLDVGQEWVENEGSPGFIVTVQRIHLNKNQEVSRETISTDEFESTPRVIRVGSRQPESSEHK